MQATTVPVESTGAMEEGGEDGGEVESSARWSGWMVFPLPVLLPVGAVVVLWVMPSGSMGDEDEGVELLLLLLLLYC